MDTTILGFEPYIAAAIVAVAIAYDLVVLSPLIFPAVFAFRQRATLNRKLFFILAVAGFTYGLLLAFVMMVWLPVAGFMVYVAPQMRASGYLAKSWLISISDFAAQWWLFLLPPAIGILSLLVTRYLGKRWNRIDAALRS